ncbi:MAG: hypothetical protein JW699_02775 [Chitinispirillaceae bacterium]|nr:hypothetical protein [Chitinispirillaceae bacterium]
MKLQKICVCSLVFATAFQGFAAQSDSMLAGSTRLSNGTTMYFRLYVPRSYTTTKKYPVVVTLHGGGEMGSDNRVQVDREEIVHQWMLDSVKQKYAPFILCPQCPSGNVYWSNWYGDGSAWPPDSGVVKILDSLKGIYSLDTTRFYVAGLSLGGAGTWGLIKSFPQKFAAAVPCAGNMGVNQTVAQIGPSVPTIFRTPYWAFHGVGDPMVSVNCDRRIDTAVRNAGHTVVYYVSDARMTNPRGISTDSLKSTVAGGALRLYSEVNNMPDSNNHALGWMEAWFHPFLVPWVFSKSKVNQATVFTWPAPGPAEVTAVSKERRAPSRVSEKLRAANGVVRWNGVSQLPAHLGIYSAKGALVRRHGISQRDGTLTCSGLAKGVYLVEIVARDWRERKILTIYDSGK